MFFKFFVDVFDSVLNFEEAIGSIEEGRFKKGEDK